MLPRPPLRRRPPFGEGRWPIEVRVRRVRQRHPRGSHRVPGGEASHEAEPAAYPSQGNRRARRKRHLGSSLAGDPLMRRRRKRLGRAGDQMGCAERGRRDVGDSAASWSRRGHAGRHRESQHVADGAAVDGRPPGEARTAGSALARRRRPSAGSPVVLVLGSARCSMMNPLRSCPANRTLTRTPGCAVAANSGHRVLKGAVQVRQTGVDEHDGHGVGNTLGVGNDLRVGVRRGGTHVHSTESNGAR